MRYGLLGMQRLSQEWRMQKLRRLWSWRSLLRLSSSSQETQKRRMLRRMLNNRCPNYKKWGCSLQTGTTSLFMRKEAMSPYAVIPTNGILNKASQIFNWQSVSFKCRFISPVLHENKQGVLPYAIAFCVESGVLNLQETFLKTSFITCFLFSPYILSTDTIRILLPRGRQTRK